MEINANLFGYRGNQIEGIKSFGYQVSLMSELAGVPALRSKLTAHFTFSGVDAENIMVSRVCDLGHVQKPFSHHMLVHKIYGL